MLSFLLNLARLFKAIVRSWRMPTFRATLSLAAILLLTGTVFYHRTEGWSWIDSLYFSTTTMSTVGFGDLTPQTDIGKLFTVVYIFVGVGVFVALFTQLARALLKVEEPTDSPTAKDPTKD